MKKFLRSVSFLILTLLLLPSTALGCSEPVKSQSEKISEQKASDQKNEDKSIPHFTGPWADEVSSAYRRATSDFEKKALSEGKISESTFAEVENRLKTCLSERKITFSGFNTGGSYGFHFPEGMTSEEANKIADKCSASSGQNTVGSIYFAMQRNPKHLDEATIVSTCLVKKNVAPQGYGASDFEKDSVDNSFPFVKNESDRKALDACFADPLAVKG